MNRYRIIRFDSGKYAVLQKSIFGDEYVSLNTDTTWAKNNHVRKYCIGSKSEAIERYYELTNKGKDVTKEVLG